MGVIYYPSCKFTAQFPQTSKDIKAYVAKRYNAKIAGCCKASLKAISAEDTIIYICNTCAAFFRESSLAGNVISLWELVASDDNYAFPDYSGRRISIQDCWRVYDNILQQDAVRTLLYAMNIETVELHDNREKTMFCGNSLYESLPANYGNLAPKRLVEDATGFFVPHTPEENTLQMREHCSLIETEEVLCYCVACVNGIIDGGKKGVHLAELLFHE